MKSRHHYLAPIVLTLSLIATLLAWTMAEQYSYSRADTRFELRSQQFVDAIEVRINGYEHLLAQTSAMLALKGLPTPGEWRQYVNAIELERRLPESQGFSLAVPLRISNTSNLAQAFKQQGIADISISPAPAREVFYPAIYIEPFDQFDQQMAGYDLAGDTNGRAALRASILSGKPVMSGIVQLLQSNEQDAQAGFVMMTPAYREVLPSDASDSQRIDKLLAIVSVALRAGDFMEGLLGDATNQVRLQIFDGPNGSSDSLLYDSLSPMGPAEPGQRFSTEKSVNLYSHLWTIKTSAGDNYLTTAESRLSLLIALGGVFFSLLLGWATFLLTRRQQAARQIANRMISEAAESEHRFRLVVDATDTGMVIIDKAGTIAMANRAIEKIFGFPETVLVGKQLNILIPEFESELENGAITEENNADLLGLHKDGEPCSVEVRVTTMVNPNNNGLALATITDISERKAKEAQSQEIMADLERSNAELEQFAHASSHDLKAPLRAIDNLAQWIDEDTQDLLPPESKRHLSLMRKRVQRMEQLLDDLLVYGRIGADLSSAAPVHLKTMIDEISELVNPESAFRISLYSDQETLITHRTPLFHVLLNLISNAIKHHDKSMGVISVRSRCEDNRVSIEISDDGPGIKQEHHGRIFLMYQTLRPRDEVEGSGMGLATARKIVSGYGGQLNIASTEGPGASFIFDMPTFEDCAKNTEQPTTVPAHSGRNDQLMAVQT